MTVMPRWRKAIMPSYAPPAISAVRGQGAVIWDEDGKSYLDMLGGIAVNSLGHAHPAIVEAVTHQISTLGHVSNLVASDPAVTLAEKLVELVGIPGTVFFSNSGAEANEAALKIARRTGRRKIVAMQGGFHGRTMGALSLTGQPAKQTPFMPMLEAVVHVPFGDIGALNDVVDQDTAMVIMEPILGEAGVIAPITGYLATAREITASRGALLAFDEVQTGIGRTGKWFACQREHVAPDIITLAKGLGGGLPIGATIALGSAGALLQPGQHGSTFGGNPVSCAAALAVLRTIEADKLLYQVEVRSRQLREGIAALGLGVRGAGLLLAIVFDKPVAAEVEEKLREEGFLVNAVTSDAIRLAPPFVLTAAQVDSFLIALARVSGGSDIQKVVDTPNAENEGELAAA
ncbi:MAG: acetylornithine transaminase [Corynebacteriales bacterium]|nr:acetylornithine transaminase [Mycobacteriales bacterium]